MPAKRKQTPVTPFVLLMTLGACATLEGVPGETDFLAAQPTALTTTPCGRLSPNAALGPGASLASCNQRATLVHQGDGNVVLYDAAGPLWATNTPGNATSSFVMQGDGNVVLYGSSGALWNSVTYGHGGAHLEVGYDCNLAVYSSKGDVLWQTGTRCRGNAGAEVGLVTGSIYSQATGGGWPLDQTSAVDDIARLGAKWVRLEILPVCTTPTTACERAEAYDAVFAALRSKGVKVLALINHPTVDSGRPSNVNDLSAVDTWWSTKYEPRVEEVLNRYAPDAIEIINEPNSAPPEALPAEAFALIVKRTYERLHDGLHVSTPIIAGGIINLYDDPQYNDTYHRKVAGSVAFADYEQVYGRWPMDGWGVHPYQFANWCGHRGNIGSFLRQSLLTIRGVIKHPAVPFWVTEFGWQDSPSCTACDGSCANCQDNIDCADQISTMMTEAFGTFKDPAVNVATAFWYDYRDDEPGGPQRFGLRKNSTGGAAPAGAPFAPKPTWYTFQTIAGGAGAPTTPPTTTAPAYDKIYLRGANATSDPRLQIFFKTAESNFYSEDKSVWVSFPVGGGWLEVVADMAPNPRWRGTITGVRVDPTPGSGHFGIDYVYVGTAARQYVLTTDFNGAVSVSDPFFGWSIANVVERWTDGSLWGGRGVNDPMFYRDTNFASGR
jgi:hypothetical protein